jgi:hypothetical protein
VRVGEQLLVGERRVHAGDDDRDAVQRISGDDLS